MNSRRKYTSNYKRYSEETLNKALQDIRTRKLSLRQASKKYKICVGTLSNKLNRKHMSQVGHPNSFTSVEEKAFVQHILKVAEWGFPFDITDIRIMAKNYLSGKGRVIKEFKNNLPSSKWVKGFIKRHPILRERKCQNIKKSRASVSSSVIEEYFKNLKETVEGVPPSNFFNYDETNLSDDPGTKKCVFKRGVKYPERVRDNTKTAISIMFCGSASGKMMPAYVVYKSENIWSTWTEGGPPLTRYNRTKSGWFDSVTFTDWFERVFVANVKNLPGPKVILGDNLSSHFNEKVLQLCEENDIRFVCLPANTTHLLQPLDVAYYGPLKRAWRKILDNYKIQCNRKSQTLSKDQFPRLLTKLYASIYPNEEEQSKNIVSGFVKTGLYPFNSKKVLERLPDYKKINENDQNVNQVQTGVSDAVEKLLKEMRGVDTLVKKGRKKKIEVPAGKSISVEDLQNQTPDGDNSRKPEERRKKSKKEIAEANVEASDDEDNFSPLSEEKSDASEDVDEDNDFENISDHDLYEDSQNDNLPINPQIEKFYVIEFRIKQHVRHYIGKVVDVIDDDNVFVKFLRMSKKTANKFTWPTIEDEGIIRLNELRKPLTDPILDRRDVFVFKSNEIKSFLSSLS